MGATMLMSSVIAPAAFDGSKRQGQSYEMRNCPLNVVSTAVVGPNSLFREGLRGLLPPPYQAETVAETIESVPQIVELNLILLLADADPTALLAQVRHAKAEHANARIVVIGDIDASEVVWPLLVAGADGYLLRKISPEALSASLDAVMLGATVMQSRKGAPTFQSTDCAGSDEGVVESKTSKLDADAQFDKLSKREAEILVCLTKGESNKHIARKCEIAEATVKVHLKAILRKLRVSNRTQAAVWAHNNYLVRPTH